MLIRYHYTVRAFGFRHGDDERVCAVRTDAGLTIPSCDGRRWKKSDQTRPVKDALKSAGLALDGSRYALRLKLRQFALKIGLAIARDH